MKINIQTPDYKAPKKLTNFAKQNLLKLSVLGDRILEAHVVLKKDRSNTKKDKLCELKLAIPGNDLFAARQSTSFEEALTDCIEAIKHQLSRWKDSVNPGKQRGKMASFQSEETLT